MGLRVGLLIPDTQALLKLKRILALIKPEDIDTGEDALQSTSENDIQLATLLQHYLAKTTAEVADFIDKGKTPHSRLLEKVVKTTEEYRKHRLETWKKVVETLAINLPIVLSYNPETFDLDSTAQLPIQIPLKSGAIIEVGNALVLNNTGIQALNAPQPAVVSVFRVVMDDYATGYAELAESRGMGSRPFEENSGDGEIVAKWLLEIKASDIDLAQIDFSNYILAGLLKEMKIDWNTLVVDVEQEKAKEYNVNSFLALLAADGDAALTYLAKHLNMKPLDALKVLEFVLVTVLPYPKYFNLDTKEGLSMDMIKSIMKMSEEEIVEYLNLLINADLVNPFGKFYAVNPFLRLIADSE